MLIGGYHQPTLLSPFPGYIETTIGFPAWYHGPASVTGPGQMQGSAGTQIKG